MIRPRLIVFAGLAALCLARLSGGAEVSTSPAASKASAPQVPTVIESGAAEAISTDKETTFTFSKGVTVTATNLKMTSDSLIVVSKRSGDAKATLGKQDNFKSLVATGRVHIVQNDREVFSDRAEIFPGDDKVVVTGNPATWRTLDGQYKGSGPEFSLLRGERRIVMPKATFTLPALRDLGYDKSPEKKKAAPAGSAAQAEAPKQVPPSLAPAVTVPPLAPPK